MLTLANRLTILRILMTPVFITLLLYRRTEYALGIFLLAGITDALDGFVARARGQKTQLGMVLDPLADKLLLTSAFVTLAFLRIIPRWFAIVAVSRDVFLVGGSLLLYIFTGKIGIPPSALGKATTALQLLTVLGGLGAGAFWPPARAPLLLVIPTAALTVASGLDYVYRGARLFNE